MKTTFAQPATRSEPVKTEVPMHFKQQGETIWTRREKY